jgi:tRNA (guanine37-N1)-methyltransferase
MQVQVLTLFPDMFPGPLQRSIVGRAMASGLLELGITDIRDYAYDSHRSVDDYQFGGGSGMVMKPGPVFEATEAVLDRLGQDAAVVLTSPQGKRLHQGLVYELAQMPAVVIICGHYQGVDERVTEHLATHVVSIGDYVLSGGELPAMVLVESICRLLPGAVGSADSVEGDSITTGLLQHPLYTRPSLYRQWPVPDVLLSGNHAEIDKWRRRQSLLRTLRHRPDLLDSGVESGLIQSDDVPFLESPG